MIIKIEIIYSLLNLIIININNMIDSFIIDEIYTSVEILKKILSKNTQIILIGQTSNYLKYCFSSDYDIKCVAISGRVFIDESTIPTKDNLFKYYDYLKSKNIENKYTVLIDHSHSGQSITSFSKILNRYFDYIDKNDMNHNTVGKCFDFINLISPIQINGWIKKPDARYINTFGYIIMPHLVDIANEKLPRTIHHYPHWNWNKQIFDTDFYDIDNTIKNNFNNKNITNEVQFKKYIVNPNTFSSFSIVQRHF